MTYKENPKTKGSGIICAIPQKGTCPYRCDDCFFQSGRSYLEPLDENTPNMPSFEEAIGRVVRVNDGNDSNVNFYEVEKATRKYPMRFFNTSYPYHLKEMKEPVVLTLNPGKMTDKEWHKLEEIPPNLMFVRIRTNMWNMLNVVIPAVEYYSKKEVPIVLTFMAYFDTADKIPKEHQHSYMFRKRTLNSYYAITTASWDLTMSLFNYNKWVYSCGKIEGERGTTACARCGNCIREYFVTKERMKNERINTNIILA